MAQLKNDRLIRALNRQSVDKTPVWVMRQAGRYLPEYRATRKKAGDFMTLCKTPELACEVAMQPINRFALDAAILFSDILTIPDAMGLGLYFAEGEGPRFRNPVRTLEDIKALGAPDPEQELRYVIDAVRVIRRELDGRIPLIGFAGSPWTLATYMVEGCGSKDFSCAKRMLFDKPDWMHVLLETLTRSVTNYLNAQISAGAQVIMIFDTWGGLLTPRDYQQFSLRYMKNIVESLEKEHEGRPVPVVLFTKNGGQWLEQIAQAGASAVGLDWTVDINDARSRIGSKVALQGNMDPSILYASPDRIRTEVDEILQAYGSGSGHVFNLGHGIHQGVDPENVAVLVDTVHELSAQYHL